MKSDVSKLIRFTLGLYALISLYTLSQYLFSHFASQGVPGKHLGGDFVNYWVAAKTGLSGTLAPLFDPHNYANYAQTLWPDGVKPPDFERLNFSYPPHTAILLSGFGLFSYVPAWIIFTLSGLLCFILASRHFVQGRTWLLLAAFAPAGMACITAGQNGFFSAALLIGGLGYLRQKPVLAGILFGLLTFKPQFGVLLVIALLCRRDWTAILSASVTTIILIGLSIGIYGTSPWHSFIVETLPYQQHLLNIRMGLFDHMVPSLYKAVINLGGPVILARFLQGLLMLACLVATIKVFLQRDLNFDLQICFLLTATVLFTPYVAIYDLLILSVATIIFGFTLFRQGKFGRGPFYLTGAVLMLPIAHVTLSTLGMPIGSLVIIALALAIWGELHRQPHLAA